MNLARLTMGIAALLIASASAGNAGTTPDRAARFASYKAAHPSPKAEIADIRKRTAALIAADPASAPTEALLDRAPIIWRTGDPVALWDGVDFPEMIVVPAGEYTMGSALSEPFRHSDEGPRHRVRIAHATAVSKYPVTVAEFARFVAATGYETGDGCKTYENSQWDDHRAGRTWRNPGYAQSPADPVVCMNWNDAHAYVAWLSKKTGHAYRLLTEAEYEYANRAGTVTPYWWGQDIAGNHAICDACGMIVPNTETAPVGGLAPNPFGLYDTTGNAWSWVEDCWKADYDGAPVNGGANRAGDCTQHAERGGAWYYTPGSLRSAIRQKDPASLRNYHNSFRVAFTL